ncbi:ammonia-dependent NAD(+) synthetase [Alkalicoccus halolimnae]|uniref:NH(3)-dependent NAD(+) synthetase n=1 Tax=Alkalicoccus halolimnae TaxID=1667239 RepID=A0A5C7F995_9BACI|nr:ammonia-dependent NAD(+) synthetase [Alkalicoccus halolimnae]TXF87281.1 ammonia-dependent NAD(+) synthetase [Alkalicoccus halolimnae]
MHNLQKEIISSLEVKPEIDVQEEIRTRVNFLKAYLKKSGAKGYVIGISGGQDSSLAGKLIQQAIDELNEEEEEGEYMFCAVRLPHGEQADEEDAQKALDYISPNKTVTVNIKPAVDASESQFKEATGEDLSDFVKGNTKARERMKVQYDLAAHYGLLVAGTDHAAEAVTGFYTKFGDGACDVAPLFGLNKRQGKMLLKELQAPDVLVSKVPTADLEDDQPLLSDEEALGVKYKEIDEYLEGKTIKEASKDIIESKYRQTGHKREMPVTPHDYWWQA